ncbi:MAG TPA: hypothetical protein VHQ41_02315 [Patescibacteria group bacterium]|jgi:hypothetical protein|nr:hypothetical protein [Patescibacteria group bacterium]
MIEFIKNLDKEKIKAKFQEKGKPLAIAGVCFVAVFIAGFGTGRVSHNGSGSATTKRSLTNYTTNTSKTKTDAQNTNTATKPAATSKTTTSVDPNNCYIKGSKSKIYHVPGGSFYERTNPAACFASEQEAQAAGYTKSSR